MQRSLVVTVIGPDRPGLVESIATVVAEHSGNWVESRLARLAGKFAGVVRVDVPAANAAELTRALLALKSRGLATLVEETDKPAHTAADRTLKLEVIGLDRPGIVRDVSRALAQRSVNVVELHTECFSAAMSGEEMFRATADLHVPADLPLTDLRQTLQQVASALGVDFTLDSP